jgi:hypothetical protein
MKAISNISDPRKQGFDIELFLRGCRGVLSFYEHVCEDCLNVAHLMLVSNSGAREPAVLRSFSVLFEDYLPIRLAGRRIYNYLVKLIEEIRLERQGEIARAQEIINMDVADVIEHAHDVWDLLMDESLLLEESLNSDDKGQPQDIGVLLLSQLKHLCIEQVLVDMNLIEDCNDFEQLFEYAVSLEGKDTKQHTKHFGNNSEMTFVSFIRMLHQCLLSKYNQNKNEADLQLSDLLERLQRHATQYRCGNDTGKHTSTLLAAKAINSGNNNTCIKRQRHSDRFDQYVSTFKVWEEKFVGGRGSEHPSRRLGKFILFSNAWHQFIMLNVNDFFTNCFRYSPWML